MDNVIKLSPSGIKRFESCNASWIFSNIILPNIDSKHVIKIAGVGRVFHETAESDFDDITTDGLTLNKPDDVKAIIEECAEVVKGRYYYKYDANPEYYVSTTIAHNRELRGYIDRVCFANDNKVIIVDYKTSMNMTPHEDMSQLISYAYILWKNGLVSPEHIELVLDYVKLGDDGLVIRKVTNDQLVSYGNYLVTLFDRVNKVVDTYKKDKDIKKVVHSPGNCSFCPMEGNCIAYQMTINPHYDPLDMKKMDTSDIIKELTQRTTLWKLNEGRSKALKRALLERKSRDIDGDDELISEHFNSISITVREYPTDAVVNSIVKKTMEKAVKSSAFSGLVDTQVITNTLCNIMKDILPKKIGKRDIPENMKSEADKIVVEYKRPPYLKAK